MILALVITCFFTLWFYVILELGYIVLKFKPATTAWKVWVYFSLAASTAINALLITIFS